MGLDLAGPEASNPKAQNQSKIEGGLGKEKEVLGPEGPGFF